MLRRQGLFVRILAWFAATVLTVTAVTATMIWYLYEEAADRQLSNAIDLLQREGEHVIGRLEGPAAGLPATSALVTGLPAADPTDTTSEVPLCRHGGRRETRVSRTAKRSSPRDPPGEAVRVPIRIGAGPAAGAPDARVAAAGVTASLPTEPLCLGGSAREALPPPSSAPRGEPPTPGGTGPELAPFQGPHHPGWFPIWVFDDVAQLVWQPPTPPFPPRGPGSRDAESLPGFAGMGDHPDHHGFHAPRPNDFDPGPPPPGFDPGPHQSGFDPGPPPDDLDPGPPPEWQHPDGGFPRPPTPPANRLPAGRTTEASPRLAGPDGARGGAGGFPVRRPGRAPLDVSLLASAARDFLAASASTRLVEIDGDEFLCARLAGPSGRSYVGMLLFRPPPFRLVQRLLTTPALGVRLLIVLGVAALLCWLLARTLVGPVLELRGLTRRIAAGEFHSRLPDDLAGRGDELGDLARDFNRMADTIDQALFHQRQLLRDVSHELRSPLARVQIALELLRQKVGGTSDGLVGKIDRDLGRLNELIQQILDLSRFEQGQAVPLKFEPVDLADLVRHVAGDVQFEADLSGKRIVASIPEETLPVAAAPEFLRRAVENVLRNAVRHTPDGTSIDLAIEPGPAGPTGPTGPTEASGSPAPGMVTVRVRDHGAGVAEANLPRLFDPFFRCEEDRGRQTGGMGLGLAIVRKAIEAHSGTVEARNADGGGLEVLIRLPRAKG